MIECDDYLPYGELLSYGGSVPCNNTQSTTHKFTSKERDAESNLDYFGARYYSSTLGRFVTSDWAMKPEAVPYADFTDPQMLNLYSYVRSNPLGRMDQDGHNWQQVWNDIKAAASQVYVKAAGGVGLDLEVGAGPAKFTIGAAAMLSGETSPAAILKVSASAEAGVSVQLGSVKVGESVSSDTPLFTLHNDKSVTGVENTQKQIVDTIGGHTTTGTNASDRVGASVGVGLGAHASGEAGLTKQGSGNLRDAAKEAINSVRLPNPPHAPAAPPSPPSDLVGGGDVHQL